MRRILEPVLRQDFTLTKRHLGLLLAAGGLVLAAGMIGAEILDPDSGGFGTVQRLGTLVGALSLVVGLSLLPLKNQPA